MQSFNKILYYMYVDVLMVMFKYNTIDIFLLTKKHI